MASVPVGFALLINWLIRKTQPSTFCERHCWVWRGGKQLRGGTCKPPNCWPKIHLSSKMAGKGEIIWILGAGMGISKRWESPGECSGLPGMDHEGRNEIFWWF